ncbi:hypothetical protein GCM10023238_24100 [Streptomyces heliomycini]
MAAGYSSGDITAFPYLYHDIHGRKGAEQRHPHGRTSIYYDDTPLGERRGDLNIDPAGPWTHKDATTWKIAVNVRLWAPGSETSSRPRRT